MKTKAALLAVSASLIGAAPAGASEIGSYYINDDVVSSYESYSSDVVSFSSWSYGTGAYRYSYGTG